MWKLPCGSIDMIATGDLILMTRPGYFDTLTRFFTGGDWNHVGIAVRKKDNYIVDSPKLECNEGTEGYLYVLEIVRPKSLAGPNGKFVAFRCIPFEKSVRDCTVVGFRSLKPEFRKKAASLIPDFFRKMFGTKCLGFMDQIYMFLKTEMTEGGRKKRGMSCTMMVNKFMRDVLGHDKKELYGLPASYDPLERSRDPGVDIYYEPCVALCQVKHQRYEEVLGLIIAFSIIWLVFWAFSEYIFDR